MFFPRAVLYAVGFCGLLRDLLESKKFGFPKIFLNDIMPKGVPVLALTFFMFLIAVAIMIYLKIKENPAGFAVSNRYFIFLTPLGIISMTILSTLLVKAFKDRWPLQFLAFLGIGYWVVSRALKNIEFFKNFLTGIFS